MSLLVLAVVGVALIGVAAAGVVAPLVRRELPAVEPLTDPLEDRRLALLLSLKDLEEARASGALEEEEHAKLRAETEARLARVLRALEERRDPARRPVVASREGGMAVPSWVAPALVAGAVLVAAVPGLLGSVGERGSGAVFTGDLAGSEGAQTDPLAFFQERVGERPRDVAARLDLARRYLDAGRVQEAIEQYRAALDLDPDNAEAHAHLGVVLYLAGRPREGLAIVERALETDPRYPEALFFKGVILLRGLDRPAAAAEALRAYLEAAPFGGEREEAERLLEEAERG